MMAREHHHMGVNKIVSICALTQVRAYGLGYRDGDLGYLHVTSPKKHGQGCLPGVTTPCLSDGSSGNHQPMLRTGIGQKPDHYAVLSRLLQRDQGPSVEHESASHAVSSPSREA